MTAKINVGGARLVGFFSLRGERSNLGSAISVCINVEDIARGSQIENNNQCQWG